MRDAAAGAQASMPATGGTTAVVVTGASSGIGEAVALELDRLGYAVFAGCRTAAAAERLSVLGSKRLTPVRIDVTRPATLRAAAELVAEDLGERGSLTGIVNSAGVVVSGPLERVPLDALRRQLDVNVVGPLAVVQAFLPLLRGSRGRIVNIGSTSGRIAGPWIGPYCASKFALEALTSALRDELRSAGIRVTVVEPGVVATPLWDKVAAAEDALAAALVAAGDEEYRPRLLERQRQLQRIRGSGDPPRKVAAAVVEALTSARPKSRYVVGSKARLKMLVALRMPNGMLQWLRERRTF